MGLWDLPGLPEHLQPVYKKLSQSRTFIQDGDVRLSVYAGYIEPEEVPAIHELMTLGFVVRVKIGKRWVLRLGTWEIIEHRVTPVGRTSRLLTDEMQNLLRRYDGQQVKTIESAFVAFESLRKRGKISTQVLLRQLQIWAHFPQEFVHKGLTIYLDRQLSAEGKDERYATGCIRQVFRRWRDGEAIKIPEGTQEREARQVHATAEDAITERSKKEREDVLKVDKMVDAIVKERYGATCKTSDVPLSVLVKLRVEAARRCSQGAF